jgi:hypothetical protein
VFADDERYRIYERLRRINELGYDVDELELVQDEPGLTRMKLRTSVLEPGRYRRLLRSLTGLDVQDNQARRLLNDIHNYGAWLQQEEGRPLPDALVAHRWLEASFEPTVAAVPEHLRGRRDPAEVFHEVLHLWHRWSAEEGGDLALDAAARRYVEEILSVLPEERRITPAEGDDALPVAEEASTTGCSSASDGRRHRSARKRDQLEQLLRTLLVRGVPAVGEHLEAGARDGRRRPAVPVRRDDAVGGARDHQGRDVDPRQQVAQVGRLVGAEDAEVAVLPTLDLQRAGVRVHVVGRRTRRIVPRPGHALEGELAGQSLDQSRREQPDRRRPQQRAQRLGRTDVTGDRRAQQHERTDPLRRSRVGLQCDRPARARADQHGVGGVEVVSSSRAMRTEVARA